MKIIIITLLCAIMIIPCYTKTEIEGVHVNGKLHKRRVLMNGLNRPYQLAIYDKKHQLFFSHNVGDDTRDTFAISYIKINDTMPTEVKEIRNGFALAIDHADEIVFFGGSDGIYEASLELLEVNHFLHDHNIWDIFYHENFLYFIDYPSQHLHFYDIGNTTAYPHAHIKEKIYQFVIDGNNDTFITTKTGLFEIKSGSKDRIPYSGPNIFRAVEVNRKGVAYFCAKNGIYLADKNNHTLIEIASIKNIFGLTFDAEDNIIYSNPHEIVKLLPHHE